MEKANIHAALVSELIRRIQQLQDLLDDACNSVASDTKSSAGDKHETSRAMAQIEQEKIGNQLAEMQKMLAIARRISTVNRHAEIQVGSLVQTSIGAFYLAVGIGSLHVENEHVFCMTSSAPLGKMLLGKSKNDQFKWQEKIIEILSVE
jgi:transcription elongation GreA/GreB family factor